MNIPLLLTICLASSCLNVAVAEDRPVQIDNSTLTTSKPESAVAFVPTQHLTRHPGWLHESGGRAPRDPSLDATCYSMRTYMVQRDERQSDAVHPVRYSTCQPAPRFEIKVTTQAVENASGHK